MASNANPQRKGVFGGLVKRQSNSNALATPGGPSVGDLARLSALMGTLPLTPENVEAVLEEMRPYLMADGGNVALREIDGGTVVLELQGACGTCPSSSMTLTMGLEKGLRDKIPEIISVEQVSADGVPITEEAIEAVLKDVRPFLKMTGGDVVLLSVGPDDLQPSCTLRLTGSGAALRSIKGEIIQRLRKEMPSMAGVLWDE
jgi:lysyl-tRNA synthetase class 2